MRCCEKSQICKVNGGCMRDGRGAAGRGWWLAGGGVGVCDRLGSCIISIWLTRTVWIRGGPRCPEVLIQRIELLINTWTWGDVWVCFTKNRLTDTQTDRQTNTGLILHKWPCWVISDMILLCIPSALKSPKKIINFLLQPQWRIVSSWLPFCFLLQNGWAGTKHHPSSPISRSIRWRSAAQCRLLVVEFLPFWVHSPVSLCFSGRVAPPKKDPVLWKEPRSSGDIV